VKAKLSGSTGHGVSLPGQGLKPSKKSTAAATRRVSRAQSIRLELRRLAATVRRWCEEDTAELLSIPPVTPLHQGADLSSAQTVLHSLAQAKFSDSPLQSQPQEVAA
jgi:hypothetical protein